jgi:hypothetical protein
MDADLAALSRERLLAEVRKLRDGIRAHRDSSGHDLCWHHPALWSLLPEQTDPVPVVPEWPQFLQGCIRYRQSLDEQAGHAPRSARPYEAGGIALDHAIVPSRDRKAAAERLATVLGVPWAESAIGPFSAVYVSDGLTLDFDQADGSFPVLHYCFRVGEGAFDAILARLQQHGIAYRSTPHGAPDLQVNTRHGGRIVYWSEPDGHVWEALTQSYARRP